jgi:predicted lipoprotein with Yx(FWY)xxD motif
LLIANNTLFYFLLAQIFGQLPVKAVKKQPSAVLADPGGMRQFRWTKDSKDGSIKFYRCFMRLSLEKDDKRTKTGEDFWSALVGKSNEAGWCCHRAPTETSP